MPRATRVPTRRAPAPRRQPAGRLAILPALVAALALALALVACDDAAGTTDGPQLAGTWTGSGQHGEATIDVTLVLSDAGGAVTGSGTIEGPSASVDLQVSGTRSGSSFDLTLSFTGFDPATFTGSVQGTATMVGSLDGSGFDHVALTLTRQ